MRENHLGEDTGVGALRLQYDFIIIINAQSHFYDENLN